MSQGMYLTLIYLQYRISTKGGFIRAMNFSVSLVSTVPNLFNMIDYTIDLPEARGPLWFITTQTARQCNVSKIRKCQLTSPV